MNISTDSKTLEQAMDWIIKQKENITNKDADLAVPQEDKVAGSPSGREPEDANREQY
jgi:hypothetical protein